MQPGDAARIDRLIDQIEKGYVKSASDRGGATKWGISKPVLAEWYGRPVTDAEVRDLPRDTAVAIYHARYLRPFELVTDPTLRDLVFDTAVWMGEGRAKVFLQRAVGTAVDGVLGPKTRDALQRANLVEVLRSINQQRIEFTGEIITNEALKLRRQWTKTFAYVEALAAAKQLESLVDGRPTAEGVKYLKSVIEEQQDALKAWLQGLNAMQAFNAHGWCSRLARYL